MFPVCLPYDVPAIQARKGDVLSFCAELEIPVLSRPLEDPAARALACRLMADLADAESERPLTHRHPISRLPVHAE